jgi:hypothetical protein
MESSGTVVTIATHIHVIDMRLDKPINCNINVAILADDSHRQRQILASFEKV